MRHILIILSLFLFSFTIISCSSDDGGSSSDNSSSTTTTSDDDSTTTTDNSSSSDNSSTDNSSDTTAPTVYSVYPTDNQSDISITIDNISVTFSEEMDNTSVTTNTDNTTCYGSFQLSSDNFSGCVQMSSSLTSSNSSKTFTIDPSDNLSYSTTYKIRVTTGVKDSAGNTLGSQYETSNGFTTIGLFVGVGTSGTIISSPEGTTWTTRDSGISSGAIVILGISYKE